MAEVFILVGVALIFIVLVIVLLMYFKKTMLRSVGIYLKKKETSYVIHPEEENQDIEDLKKRLEENKRLLTERIDHLQKQQEIKIMQTETEVLEEQTKETVEDYENKAQELIKFTEEKFKRKTK